MAKKVKVKFDRIPLDEMITVLAEQIPDIEEAHKYKRTPKSKRQSKNAIEFFGNCLYYLEELKKTKELENKN